MSKISLIAAYVGRQDVGKILTTAQIGEELHIKYDTVSKSMHALMRNGAPIVKLAKGTWMKSIREQIEDFVTQRKEPVTVKEIVEETGLTYNQVKGNADHIINRKDSRIIRVAPSTYAPKQKTNGFNFKEQVIYEKVEDLDDTRELIRKEDGTLYVASRVEPETVKGIRVGERFYIIK